MAAKSNLWSPNLTTLASYPGSIANDDPLPKVKRAIEESKMTCAATRTSFYQCLFPTPHTTQNGSVLCDNKSEIWSVIRQKIFPLLTEQSRDVWVMVQLILSFITLGFAIGTIARGSTTTFDIVQVSVASGFTLVSLADAGIRIVWRCYIAHKSTGNLDVETGGEIELSEVNATHAARYEPNINNAERNIEQRRQKISGLLSQIDSEEKCIAFFDCLDVLRMFSDIFLYSVTMCSVLKHASNNNHDAIDFNRSKYEGAKFVFFICMYVIFCTVRIFIIGTALKSFKKALEGEDSYSCSFSCFSSVFFLHHIGQCIVQVVIVAAIWIRVEYVPEFIEGKPFLWSSVVLGYLVPCVGNFAIFISEYYFVEELLIQSYTNSDNAEDIQYTKKMCCLKYVYTFLSPLLVVLSFLYLLFLCLFFFLSSISYDYFVTNPDDLSSVWIVSWSVMFCFILLINIQVVIIPVVWFIIISIIILGLYVAIAFILFIICALALLSFILFGVIILCICQGDSKS